MSKTYSMTEEQHAAGLSLIDDVAGPVPSEISDALEKMDAPINTIPDEAQRALARTSFKRILNANLELGTSPGEEKTNPGVILQLRDMLTNMTEEGGPVIPPQPLPGDSQAHTFVYGQEGNVRFLTSAGVFVATLPVPADAVAKSQPGTFSFAEYGGSRAERTMTVSLTPNDFRPIDKTGANGPIASQTGMTPSLFWNINGWDAALVPGKTYYINCKTNIAGYYPASFMLQYPH